MKRAMLTTLSLVLLWVLVAPAQAVTDQTWAARAALQTRALELVARFSPDNPPDLSEDWYQYFMELTAQHIGPLTADLARGGGLSPDQAAELGLDLALWLVLEADVLKDMDKDLGREILLAAQELKLEMKEREARLDAELTALGRDPALLGHAAEEAYTAHAELLCLGVSTLIGEPIELEDQEARRFLPAGPGWVRMGVKALSLRSTMPADQAAELVLGSLPRLLVLADLIRDIVIPAYQDRVRDRMGQQD